MDILYFVTFFVAFVSSILSGMAGGGGGFVMTPYWLVVGMTPAQGAATGAFMAVGMSTSSVAALRKTDHFPKDKRMMYVLVAVTLLASLLGAYVVPKIDMQVFRYALATITLLTLPLLLVKPQIQHRLSKYKAVGFSIAVGLLIIGSIVTSSAFSILFAVTLMSFFNMSVLQMTALRRIVGVVQSSVLFVAFAVQGYFIWQYAVAGFIGGSVGSYIGTKYAIRKGESFAKYALIAMSLAGAVALLAY